MKTKAIEDKSYWISHVENYRSGDIKNKKAYCRQSKINYHRFFYWYQKIIKELVNKGKLPQEALFMPIKIATKQSNQKDDDYHDDHNVKNSNLLCVLEFKRGHKLIIYNESILQSLVNMLSV